MIVINIPRLFERPRHLVLAFMAGLSVLGGLSARCYVDALVATRGDGAWDGAAS